jgi:hypothetical protein
MTADDVIARELKSLQQDVAALRRQRPPGPAGQAAPAAPAEPPAPAGEDSDLWEQMRELVDEATGFLKEAERGIAAHPAQSVVGALFLGIVIGRLLGRR